MTVNAIGIATAPRKGHSIVTHETNCLLRGGSGRKHLITASVVARRHASPVRKHASGGVGGKAFASHAAQGGRGDPGLYRGDALGARK